MAVVCAMGVVYSTEMRVGVVSSCKGISMANQIEENRCCLIVAHIQGLGILGVVWPCIRVQCGGLEVSCLIIASAYFALLH